MSIRALKTDAREILARRDVDELFAWAAKIRSPQRVLFSLAMDNEELIAWRAIEAIGRMAGIQADSDIDRVRDSIRRLLWLMNDESGGLGWRSPELIGEILVNVPDLIGEYAQILTSFLKEEPFERGTHLAVSRLAAINATPFADHVEILGQSLNDPDATIRFYAASALRYLNIANYQSRIEKLANDNQPVKLYDFVTGLLVDTTVGQALSDFHNPAGVTTS
jgi:hypothetical protein